MIRQAIMNDLERITAIYNQAIESRQAAGDTEVFTTAQRKHWFASYSDERTPIFVYVDCGIVVGYCYLSKYRPGKQALESAAEISYFIDYKHHRKGIGSKLVQHTIRVAKELGYRNLFAILLSCNSGSITFLVKHGFELWGTLPDIACIDGKTYSHYYYGLTIVGGEVIEYR